MGDPSVNPIQRRANDKPTKTRVSVYAASRKMAQMNFDPLEKLIKLYQKIQGEVIWMESLKEGSVVKKDGTTHRYSKTAHAELLNQQQRLLTELMRFGYARVPETVNIETNELPSPVINLTPKSPSITVAKDVVLSNIVDGEVVNKVT